MSNNLDIGQATQLLAGQRNEQQRQRQATSAAMQSQVISGIGNVASGLHQYNQEQKKLEDENKAKAAVNLLGQKYGYQGNLSDLGPDAAHEYLQQKMQEERQGQTNTATAGALGLPQGDYKNVNPAALSTLHTQMRTDAQGQALADASAPTVSADAVDRANPDSPNFQMGFGGPSEGDMGPPPADVFTQRVLRSGKFGANDLPEISNLYRAQTAPDLAAARETGLNTRADQTDSRVREIAGQTSEDRAALRQLQEQLGGMRDTTARRGQDVTKEGITTRSSDTQRGQDLSHEDRQASLTETKRKNDAEISARLKALEGKAPWTVLERGKGLRAALNSEIDDAKRQALQEQLDGILRPYEGGGVPAAAPAPPGWVRQPDGTLKKAQ